MTKTSQEKRTTELTSLSKEEIAKRVENLRETRKGMMRVVARYIKRGDDVAFRAAHRILRDVTRIEKKIEELESI